MTAANNPYGIFKTKKAKLLASKYNLSLTDTTSYIHHGKYITYSDVSFLIDNFWLDHFMYSSPIPLNINQYDYINIFNKLKLKYPYLLK